MLTLAASARGGGLLESARPASSMSKEMVAAEHAAVSLASNICHDTITAIRHRNKGIEEWGGEC
jgi:hypothetical protein